MNKATTTNVFYLKKTTSSECDNNKQFGISKEVIREFFGVPEIGNTHVHFKGCVSGEDFLAEIQTATDPRLGNAGIREFLQKEGGVETGDYILFTKLGGKSFSVKVIKQNTEEYKCYSKLFISNMDKHAAFFTDRGNEVFATSTPSNQTPTQIIFYGVPGSGKSHSIKKELSEKGITDLKEQTKRVVFHPEYTNADFVGQILPQSSDGGKTISYPFVPGPFTQILAKAYTHKNTHYALIIEEINRGNAAAIFGELFQLLDRLDEDETESSNEKSYEKGWSSYPINNDNINKAIQEAYNDSNIEPFISKDKFDKYKLNIGIRLPPNLSIFATMNTSDQNVFKLDNAFKRRWKLRLIPNKFKEEQEEINQRDAVVECFGFTWNNFREAVNSIIIDPDNSIDISSFADRQIGCWFTKAIKKDEKYIIEKEVFVHKVLEYLWDDVCNGDIGIFFNENYKSFAELVEDVIEKEITDIFSENLKGKLSQNRPE